MHLSSFGNIKCAASQTLVTVCEVSPFLSLPHRHGRRPALLTAVAHLVLIISNVVIVLVYEVAHLAISSSTSISLAPQRRIDIAI